MVYKWCSALVEELRSNEVSFFNVFGYHMVSPEFDGKNIYHPVTSWTSQITSYLPQAALRCRRDRTWADGADKTWRQVDLCGPISQLPRNLNSSKILKDHWSLIGSSYHQSIIHINSISIPFQHIPSQLSGSCQRSQAANFGYPHDAHLWPEDMP